MENSLIYIFKVNVVFSALFMMYYFFLRKQKFLFINRVTLIGIVIVAFILPIVPNLLLEPLIIERVENTSDYDQSNPVGYPLVGADMKPSNTVQQHQQLDFPGLYLKLYLLISTIIFLKLLLHLRKLSIIIRKSKIRSVDGIRYCEPLLSTAPFSFFNYIIIPKSDISPDVYHQIIVHEKAHVKQFHSLDILFSEVISAILWINPLVYLYKRQVRLNLEFLADEIVVNSGIDPKSYQLNLLSYGMLASALPVNHFFSSKLKERIYMINRKKPTIGINWNYFLLPLMILAMNFFLSPQIVKSSIILEKVIIEVEKKEPMAGENMEEAMALQPIEKTDIKIDSHPKSVKTATTTEKNKNLSRIYINARTDTVKINLIQDSSGSVEPFKGIYVIEDKIMSDNELRRALQTGEQLEFILAKRPVVGIYTENDSTAIRRWGKIAENGVIYVIANKN